LGKIVKIKAPALQVLLVFVSILLFWIIMCSKGLPIFEKFDDCWREYSSYAEEAIFTYAFKLGAKLVYEALCEHSE
jgi:hypothetical protein